MPENSSFDEIADRLYAVDPAEFVAVRKTEAARAKDSGDRRLAKDVGALRKPTVVGWLVNLLVREEPEDIADLFDLGSRLREAQRKSASRDLRDLSQARQQAVRALSTRAAELARAQGKTISEDALREVGQTLGAGLADPEIGERVRTGRVVTAESYSGFGPAVLALVPEPEDPETEPAADTTPEDDVVDDHASTEDQDALDEAREALEGARVALDEAQEDEDAARSDAERSAATLSDAKDQLAEIKSTLSRLREELHAAEEAEAEARRTEKSAERETRRLQRVLSDAESRTSEMKKAVEDLQR